MSRTTYFTALLVVVAAAVFAPLSQAMTVITDNSPSQNGPGQSAYVNSPGGNPAAYLQALGIADNTYDRAISVFESKEHPAVSQNPVSFTTENASSQNRVSLLNAVRTGALTPSSKTFDWGDAGVGAGTVGGIVLLIAAAMLASVRRSGNRRLAL
ncbi:MAG TPA: hypothetical protein VIK66_09095 [Gaiellaceae bacterium]